MIIINADDWGRSPAETNNALICYKEGRITSASAMVFMEDSLRAAELANDVGIDVGLHLNLSQQFTGEVGDGFLRKQHDRIVRFLTHNKYNLLLYYPSLRHSFLYVYNAQVKEFVRLYGRPPSHIDSHHHMHLCTNMLLDKVIPRGEKVRRSFYFSKAEKPFVNRAYRYLVDWWLVRNYFVTDFFFSLLYCLRADKLLHVVELAKTATVELMTHPVNQSEFAYLMSRDYLDAFHSLEKSTYNLI